MFLRSEKSPSNFGELLFRLEKCPSTFGGVFFRAEKMPSKFGGYFFRAEKPSSKVGEAFFRPGKKHICPETNVFSPKKPVFRRNGAELRGKRASNYNPMIVSANNAYIKPEGISIVVVTPMALPAWPVAPGATPPVSSYHRIK